MNYENFRGLQDYISIYQNEECTVTNLSDGQGSPNFRNFSINFNVIAIFKKNFDEIGKKIKIF